ncbi:MAG TPA: flagellin, partial [Pseudomonas sp.]|nr:flagellin [Pseudomonas sp.]
MPSFRQEAGLSSLQDEGGVGKAPQNVDVNEAV